MEIITSRGEGKTRNILDWAAAPPEGVTRAVVFVDHDTAMRMYRQYGIARGMQPWQFGSWAELVRGAGIWGGEWHQPVQLAVDQVELCVSDTFSKAHIQPYGKRSTVALPTLDYV